MNHNISACWVLNRLYQYAKGLFRGGGGWLIGVVLNLHLSARYAVNKSLYVVFDSWLFTIKRKRGFPVLFYSCCKIQTEFHSRIKIFVHSTNEDYYLGLVTSMTKHLRLPLVKGEVKSPYTLVLDLQVSSEICARLKIYIEEILVLTFD